MEAAMAHGQWTEVEARGALGALQKSGLTIERFCAERGLARQRIFYWKHKLSLKSSSKNSPSSMSLLPVRVVEPKRGEPVSVVLRSGHMVKVGCGFDEEAFARVVAILDGA